jgi:hypothetical protein
MLHSLKELVEAKAHSLAPIEQIPKPRRKLRMR